MPETARKRKDGQNQPETGFVDAPETNPADPEGEGAMRDDAPPPATATGDGSKDPRWAALTAPFPAEWIEKLPKPVRRNDDNKGRCQAQATDNKSGPYYSADGHYCGGWHARSVHLDYVGHAGVTMRLNDVLGPEGWDFRPYAVGPDGLPVIGRQFYASLTILGVTKWDLADNFGGPQEAYGDALRRCAMRFGMGTYLWSRSEHAAQVAQFAEPDPDNQGGPPEPSNQDPEVPPHVARLQARLDALGEETAGRVRTWWANESGLPGLFRLTADQADLVNAYLDDLVAPGPHAAR